jgi:hypothetical protein
LKVEQSYKQHFLGRRKRSRRRGDGGNDEGMYNQNVSFEVLFFFFPLMVRGLVHLEEHDHNEIKSDIFKGCTKI